MTHVIAPIAATTEELFALARSAVDDGADLLELRLDTCIEQGADAQAVIAVFPICRCRWCSPVVMPKKAVVGRALNPSDWLLYYRQLRITGRCIY